MTLTESIQRFYALAVELAPAAYPPAALQALGAAGLARPLFWRVCDAQGKLLEERRPAQLPVCAKPWVAKISAGGLRHECGFAPLKGSVTASEQAQLTELVAQMAAAEVICHRVAVGLSRAQATDAADPSVGTAVSASSGALCAVDERFREQLLHAHRFWDERVLPFAIEWQDKLSAQGIVWQGLYFKIDRIGVYYHLRVRKDRRAPELSPREYEIADRIARGKTFKEVARELDVAPSTVSTHLYNLYDKLGIRRRAELVIWLERRRVQGPERRMTPEATDGRP